VGDADLLLGRIHPNAIPTPSQRHPNAIPTKLESSLCAEGIVILHTIYDALSEGPASFCFNGVFRDFDDSRRDRYNLGELAQLVRASES
jgi:hypothetical protein